MASAYRPLVQCQPSITKDSEQLTQFSVINGRPWHGGEPWNLDDFATAHSRASQRNLAKLENCEPCQLYP